MLDGADRTRQRLIEAAGQEFATKGFEGATIRAIAERAEANVAAVNYHFGSKEGLYERAVVEAHRSGVDELRLDEGAGGPPEDRLRRMIRHMLEHVLAISDPESWQHQLMMREMTRPTAASQTLIREVIRPKFQRMGGILAEICPEADDRRLAALTFSVVGQCLFYRIVGPLAARLTGPELFRSLDLDYLADHIAGFTLAALGRAGPLGPAGEAGPVGRAATGGDDRCAGSP